MSQIIKIHDALHLSEYKKKKKKKKENKEENTTET
jgi:hypothetical protein